jgi:hypothetical protein
MVPILLPLRPIDITACLHEFMKIFVVGLLGIDPQGVYGATFSYVHGRYL